MDVRESRIRGLPIWRKLDDLAALKGGVSNASFVASDATGKYVVRIGVDYPFHQVSRERELITSRAAFAAGLSPEPVYAETGISVFRFVAAKTFAEADVQARWEDCLGLVQRCHRDIAKHITGQGAIFWVFQILRDYGAQLIAAQHRMAANVPGWMDVTQELEAAQVPLPIIFGHHDLLPSNVMDDGTRLWLIDWEYGAFGTAMFDLANLAANNSFDTKTEQSLVEAYFGKKPDAALARAFAAMKVASALREALWGMVSELHLNAPGVDYVAYAKEYLGRYEAAKKQYWENWK